MKLSHSVIGTLFFCLILFTTQNIFASEENISETLIQVHVTSSKELQNLIDLGLQIELNIIKNNIAEGFISAKKLEQVVNAGYDITVIEPPPENDEVIGPRKPWYTYNDVLEILTNYTKTYPNMTKLDTIGFSQRNRAILQFKISTLPDTAIRQRFFLNGACHGNEKIGTETVMRIIKELLEKYSSSQRIKAMVDRSDFVFHPIINVDGFTTGTNGQRRLANNKDPNRAYGYKTGGNNSDGSLPYQWPEVKTYLYSMIEAPWYQNMDYHCGTIALYTPSGSNLDRATYNRMKELYPLDKKEKWEPDIRGGGLAYAASYGKCGTIALLPELCPHYPSTSKIDSLTQWNLECYLDVHDEMNRGVRGRITNATTGEPVYARVQVKNRGSFNFSDPRSGAFHKYVPSPSGSFEVEVTANGFKPETKTVQANSNGFADVNFPLTVDTTLNYTAMSVDVIGVGNSVSLTENRRCLGVHDDNGVTIEDGFIIIDFGPKYLASNRNGDDITVYCTNNQGYSISVHNDVDKIIDDEGVDLGSGQGTQSFDLSGSLDSARWVRIDAANNSSPSIDAIEAKPREFPTAIIPAPKSMKANKNLKVVGNNRIHGVVIQAEIPKGDYSITVYNVMGKKIHTLSRGLAKTSFKKQFHWSGQKFSAGTYLIRVKTTGGEKSVKVPLL